MAKRSKFKDRRERRCAAATARQEARSARSAGQATRVRTHEILECIGDTSANKPERKPTPWVRWGDERDLDEV